MAINEVSPALRAQSPYSAVGVMFVYWPDGTAAAGSASVVGTNDILTATHMLYSPAHGGWAKSFDFYFGADYNSALGRFDSTTYSYSLRAGTYTWQAKAFASNVFADSDPSLLTYAESQFDVAVIGVSAAVGNTTGWFAIDGGRDYTQTVTQVGYPTTGSGMMASTLTVARNSFYGVYTAETDAMGPGSSGGPLIAGDGTVIGVKSAGSGNLSVWADVGTVSGSILQFMASNDTLLGTAPAPASVSVAAPAPAPAPAPAVLPVAEYSLVANSTSVDEGRTATFTFVTRNVAAGTLLGYELSGVQAADVVGGRLRGEATVGADGRATAAIGLVADQLTEGAERLTISGYGKTASTVVNDTSTAQAAQDVKLALGIYRAFHGTAPDAGTYSDILSFVGTSTPEAYAAKLAPAFASESSDSLASRVLLDVSISPSTLGGSNPVLSFNLLHDALTEMFDVYTTARGKLVFQLTSILGGLGADAVYGAAATHFDSGVSADFVALSSPFTPTGADALSLVGVVGPDTFAV